MDDKKPEDLKAAGDLKADIQLENTRLLRIWANRLNRFSRKSLTGYFLKKSANLKN